MNDDTVIITGRDRIAYELGRSERTVTRWIARGVLPASKEGPFENNLLRVRSGDLQRLKPTPHGEGREDD
jgi:hypothetical protein